MKGSLLGRSLHETPFAIIDLETTGLNAGADRIVEIAIVRKEPRQPPCLVLDTLINPHRRVAATEIHGITDGDLRDAPDFEAIAPEVVRALAGSVLAAYNVYFDMRFLNDEFGRIGVRRSLPHLCLMYLRPMLGLGSRRSLHDACAQHRIIHDSVHIASADAEAGCQLLELYLRTLREMGVDTFGQLASLETYKFLGSLENEPLSLAALRFPRTSTTLKSRRLTKPVPTIRPTEELQRIAVGLYWDTLTTALVDMEISDEEITCLQQRKKELKLRPEQIRMLHARAFAGAIYQFAGDEWLDESESRKLRGLYDCLDRLGWAPGR